MVSFGGAVQAMRVSLANNKKLLGERKRYFRKGKEFLNDELRYTYFEEEFIDHIQAEPKQIQKIQATFLKKKKRQKLINSALFFLAILFAILLVYYYTSTSKKKDIAFEVANQKEIFYRNQHQFMFFVQDGDQWFDQGNYYNAIYQYEKGLELFPNQFEAHYRVCLGYSYWCRYDQKGCEKGKKALEKALTLFPDNSKLVKLKRFFNT